MTPRLEGNSVRAIDQQSLYSFHSEAKNCPPYSHLTFGLVRSFGKGVDRVLECCYECGIGSLVFMSSSRVVSRRIRGAQAVQENSPFVTVEEDEIGHAIAITEAEVLKVRRVRF